MTDDLVTQIRSLLDYDPLSGHLSWKSIPENKNKRKDNTTLNRANSTGYAQIKVSDLVMTTLKVAWIHHYGYIPDKDKQVSSLNGDKTDCRVDNLVLRDYSQKVRQFGHNKKATSPRKTSPWYVFDQNDPETPWSCYISISGIHLCVGKFPTKDHARERRQSALKDYRQTGVFPVKLQVKTKTR